MYAPTKNNKMRRRKYIITVNKANNLLSGNFIAKKGKSISQKVLSTTDSVTETPKQQKTKYFTIKRFNLFIILQSVSKSPDSLYVFASNFIAQTTDNHTNGIIIHHIFISPCMFVNLFFCIYSSWLLHK